MSKSPYYDYRDKKIIEEWDRKMATGKYLKKQLRNILARKWGTCAGNIRRIVKKKKHS